MKHSLYSQSAASSKKLPSSISSSSVGKSIMSSTQSFFAESSIPVSSGISSPIMLDDGDGNVSDTSDSSMTDAGELSLTRDFIGITIKSDSIQEVNEAREGRVPVIFTAGKEMIFLEASQLNINLRAIFRI